jgi:hypothetical protein
MRIAFALVAIFWWIAIWGLVDIATEEWTRTEKTQFYVTILLVITVLYLFFPSILQKL